MIRKIIIVTDGWYPVVDGVVRAVDATKRELERRGIEVFIVHPGLFPNIPMPFEFQVRLSLFPRRHMREILRAQTFDALHIETEGTLGWAARAICRELHIPYTTTHQTRLDVWVRSRIMPGFDRPIYAFLRTFHRDAVRTMVSTASFRDHLVALGFKHLVVRHLGVDTELFRPRPDLPPLPYPKPIFTYMGRVAPEKNIEEFLRLDLPGTKLIVGAGESFLKLKTAYPQAVFLGFKEGEELAGLLARSDVFVFPSRFDTFGLAILEALACGTPAAAHDEIAVRDIITDGVDGCLSEDLHDVALKALSLSRDACRGKALQYTWAKSVDTFLENLAPILTRW